MDIDSYMKLCTENMSESDIKACCVGVGAYRREETIWVSAVSNDSSLLNMAEVSIGPSVDKIGKNPFLTLRSKTRWWEDSLHS